MATTERCEAAEALRAARCPDRGTRRIDGYRLCAEHAGDYRAEVAWRLSDAGIDAEYAADARGEG